jgi:hypothetical protein
MSIQLNSNQFRQLKKDGFTIAVFVKAVDFPSDSYYANTITATFKKVSIITNDKGE